MNSNNSSSNPGGHNPSGPPLHQSPQTTMEFDTVEEAIRYDASQTPVPDGLAERVNDTLSQMPSTPSPRVTSWWRRLFGG